MTAFHGRGIVNIASQHSVDETVENCEAFCSPDKSRYSR
jgi:hypothetical protein